MYVRVRDRSCGLDDRSNTGGVAQLVRVSACHAEGREFKSRHSRQNVCVSGACICHLQSPQDALRRRN